MSKKIYVENKVWVDIDQDNYKEGIVAEGVNSWDFSLSKREFDSLEELLENINNQEPIFDPKEYQYIEGNLYLDAMVNVDNEEPSEYEMEQFRAGKIDLYCARACVHLEVIEGRRELTEEDEKHFGLEC